MQIIITAGGGGTRLWPLSTKDRPKQFAKIIGEKTLIEITYENLVKKFRPEDIWVSTNINYKDTVLNLLSKTFDENRLILEPSKRDTFAAVSCAAAVVASKTSKDETLVFVPCDDYMYNQSSVDSFNDSLETIDKSIQSGVFDFIVTVIKPDSANPNYGYVEVGQKDRKRCFFEPVEVLSFIQKPDEDTAENLIQQGGYLWNKFNPTFKYSSLEKLLKKENLDAFSVVDSIYSKKVLNIENFKKLKVIDFDTAVLKKSNKLGAFGLDVTWDDIGNWDAVYKHLPKLSECSNCIQVSGTGNKIRLQNKKKRVGFVGVSNLLVVESQDGILIIDPRNTSEMKKVSGYFES